MERDLGREDHRLPGALVPRPDAQLQLVGEPQGSRRGGTSSRAASWASTTSASSTAARRCPPAARLEQADGTAWMAFYCQNMIEIALILADHDPQYEEYAFTFLQHFMWIAYAMDRIGDHHDEMWDEEDGFFYDVLRLPDGSATRLKVRSMVGLLPLCASTIFEAEIVTGHPQARGADRAVPRALPGGRGAGRPDRRGLHRLRRTPAAVARCRGSGSSAILGYLLDENEFLGPFGIRSLSRYHQDHPFVFHVGGQAHDVSYLPAESDTGMFGGNSNWRGPVWMPVNALIVRGLAQPLQVLRRRLHGRVPDRLRQPDDALRGGPGDLAAARAASSCGTGAAAARSTAGARSSRTTRTGATSSCSTSTSTATTAPASAPATRPAGRASSPASSTSSGASARPKR